MRTDDVTNEIAQSLRGSTTGTGTADALAALLKELLPDTDAGRTGSTVELVTEMAGLRTASDRQTEAVSENTDAVALNTATRKVGGESVVATVGKTVGSFLSFGFGLSPLISGLIRLFSGGSEPQPAVLPEYVLPDPIRFETSYGQAAERQEAGKHTALDARGRDAVALNPSTRNAGGESVMAAPGKTSGDTLSSGIGLTALIRRSTGLSGPGPEPQQVALPEYFVPGPTRFESPYSLAGERPEAGGYTASDTNGLDWLARGPDGTRRGAGGQAPTQVTIQVQALDSRSFLDHSEDIARAVRMAMLNSNSLNDVVNEL